MLVVSPERVDFGSDIAAQRVYKETLKVTNTLSSPVVFSLRTSAPARLSITPAECSLEAGESLDLQLKLHVTHPPSQKAPRSYRDIVFLQSTYFQQKVPAASFGTTSDPYMIYNNQRMTNHRFFFQQVNVSFTLAESHIERRVLASPSARAEEGAGREVSGLGDDTRLSVGDDLRAQLDAEFDARSEKVLKILQSKDKTIEDLRNSVKKAQDSQEQSTLELQRV